MESFQVVLLCFLPVVANELEEVSVVSTCRWICGGRTGLLITNFSLIISIHGEVMEKKRKKKEEKEKKRKKKEEKEREREKRG